MSYRDDLIAHLAEYKRLHLGDPPAGTYNHRGRPIQYDHILVEEDWRLNLLEESRAEVLAYLGANPQVRLHRYFRHLNSSQAFTLNLFTPYFEGGPDASRALLRALGQHGVSLVKWQPEAVPDEEEGTNFDALWDTDDRSRTFCEVKLSENDFGAAKPDKRHRDKLRKIYLPLFAKYGYSELCAEPGFFRSYQILRNVWHLLRLEDRIERGLEGEVAGGRLIFLMPRANVQLWNTLDTVLARLSPPHSDRIDKVAIEDVVDRLSADSSDSRRSYPIKLREKYVLPAG